MVFVESLATNLDNLRTVYLLNQDGSQRTRILGLQTRRVSFRLVVNCPGVKAGLLPPPAFYRFPLSILWYSSHLLICFLPLGKHSLSS